MQSGNLHVNWGPQWRADLMPYGGLKESGFGKEGPAYAIEEIGNDALTKVLARLADDRVAAVSGGLRGLTLAQKVTALKSWYFDDDPYMDIETSGGSYRLKERNCPYLNTAMRRPMLCSISTNALSRLLGFRVVREEKFQNGDGRCVFRVLEDQPIDPDSWEFRLEDDVIPLPSSRSSASSSSSRPGRSSRSSTSPARRPPCTRAPTGRWRARRSRARTTRCSD